jgi:Asp-tRNA(Asn)/Glu-tRNA(Gln) amidotransferase A subunit family amidase
MHGSFFLTEPPHASSMPKAMLGTPDTSVEDYVAAERGFERIRDAYADYFTRFDALLLPVLPIPAHEHDKTEFVIDGQTVDAAHVQTFTVSSKSRACPHCRCDSGPAPTDSRSGCRSPARGTPSPQS